MGVVVHHTKCNIDFGEGGSFNKEGKDGDWPFDKVEARKAEKGLRVIDFILQITK